MGVHVTREGELCIKVSLPFKNLVQSKVNSSNSFIIIIITTIYLFEFGEFLFLLCALDSRLLGGVRKGRTGIRHVSLLMALKAKFFLEAFLSFLWGKLLEFYYINVHSVGVFDSSGDKKKD